ncbi:unnamed protein product [Chrysodeixis includens]|uniref:Uncharacterized protein n=1 Tax=Chrysodeixis includens TaxID=689277 RepID=A0A9N8L7T0_CHRIL|nr:unnamed protein product [Chrysodeixis includens]
MFIKHCPKTKEPSATPIATEKGAPPPPKPEPTEPAVDPCLEQRRRDRAKRGVKICPKSPEPPKPKAKKVVEEVKVPEKVDVDCLGICFDKIKNPEIKVESPCGGGTPSSGAESSSSSSSTSSPSGVPAGCIVQRELPGTARCDKIRDALTDKSDKPPEPCSGVEQKNHDPPPPLHPPPPKRTPCEEQLRKARIAECKRRMQRYLE